MNVVNDAIEPYGAALRTGLRAKLVRVYALQVLMISVAALIGVSVTYIIVQDVLSRQALNEEADYFWERYQADPEIALPDTANMVAYLSARNPAEIPAALANLPPGFGRVHDLPGEPLVHVSRRDATTLYLIFAEEQVSNLVFYFGLAPLAAVLLTVYVLMFLAYRLSHQALSPLLELAKVLENFDFRSTDRLEIPQLDPNVDHETRLMVESLQAFGDRMELFIERERTFTRNAGHELRTPIAVLKGSLELMRVRSDVPAEAQKVTQRMTRAVNEMETMLETLLMLAREAEVYGDTETHVGDVLAEEIELLADLAGEHRNQVVFQENARVECSVKSSVLAIIVGNLLRNALTYTTAGTVTVTLEADHFAIRDTGVGMSQEEVEHAFTAFFRGSVKGAHRGQGLGLALVRRLTNQLGWTVTVQSEKDVGSEFKVFFRTP